jgi:hypothetical protein
MKPSASDGPPGPSEHPLPPNQHSHRAQSIPIFRQELGCGAQAGRLRYGGGAQAGRLRYGGGAQAGRLRYGGAAQAGRLRYGWYW